MKLPIMSRKVNTYIISKGIHKGIKITSNPLEKLTDHCAEDKTNKRDDKGSDLRSQLYNTSAPLFLFSFFFYIFLLISGCWYLFFLFPCMVIYRKIHLVQGKLAQASL